MEIYHGTNSTHATEILGPPHSIDVTKGRGELGQGFYLGTEPLMAAMLAKGRYDKAASVLKISVDEPKLMLLSSKILKTSGLVRQHWNMLIQQNTTASHKFGVDVVVAPFATFSFAHQYKFESKKAEDLLNNSLMAQIL
ncbi:hypothetical protein ACFFGT_32630 [Mucilaginibacter angelicae]|uniref:PARP catalytic domain-containing protein n=1 Tax=Mucilaginibacter angelicae TaxID=869718 RepID=A0ABV6LHT9_9SPHI